MISITIKAESLKELHEKVIALADELSIFKTRELQTPSPSPALPKADPPPDFAPQCTSITDGEPDTDKPEEPENLLPKLQTLAQDLVRKGKSADLKAMLESVKAPNLSSVPLDKQADFLSAMEAM